MKYPQLVSTPAVVKEWLEAELEGLGIDSTAYARTVLSVLTRDTTDPAEVIQSGYVIVANKSGRTGSVVPVSRQEELKRAEVIECLRSASEDQGGIQLLVDQLITMLKQLPHQQSECRAEAAVDPPEDSVEGALPADPDDPVVRYETAFPALRRPAGGVISLTYFSRLTAAPDSCAAAAVWDRPARRPPATAVWSSSFHQPISLFLRSSERDDPLDTLDTLPLRLRPGFEDAEPEPDLELELEPFASIPQMPFEIQYQQVAVTESEPSPRTIRPSTDTHFQPIRRLSGGGSAEDAPPATYDARMYRRSDSGGLYLQDEADGPTAQRPQKYMIYQGDESSGRGLAPKFKLSSNEKCCQTDDDEEVANLLAAERDLLQLLVSDEQTTQPPGASSETGDDDDSGYAVLSSLQATLNSIYEDGSDTAAESESESAAVPPRSSAFARVSRPPAADHRPLYLRGGGADSLLAAVYTDVAWRMDEPPPATQTGHRPLYARQPAAAAASAGYAQHSQLSSGRISGAVYRQGPTEYPAMRYQLAGGGLPEVTFCQLANNTTSVAGGGRDDTESLTSDLLEGRPGDSRRNSAGWPVTAGSGAPQWEACDAKVDVLLWARNDDATAKGDMVLWQVRDHAPDQSLDTSVWDSDREASEERAGNWEQAPNSDRADCAVDESWEVATSRGENAVVVNLAPGWELPVLPAADPQADITPWDSGHLESAGDGTWDSRDEDVSADDWQWDVPATSRPAVANKLLWTSRPDGCEERTLWEVVQRERVPRLAETVWEAANGSTESTSRDPDTTTEHALWNLAQPQQVTDEAAPRWRSCAEMVEQQWCTDAALWDVPESSGWSRAATDEPPGERDLVIQPPQWRKSDQDIAELEAKNQMRRLLLRLGGTAAFEDESNNNLGQGCSDDELASRQAAWEFIDENNVKNKVKLAAADGECALVGSVDAWHVLPALRQLSRCLSLDEGGALPDGVALKAWTLEEQWRRDETPRRPARDRRPRKSDRRRPCAFFMEGNCKRTDCKFSHDLSNITCVFWEESGCFKGATCPFLHGYPPEDDDEDAESSDSARRIVPKKTFKLEKEEFPSLHNTRKQRRTDDEDARRAGRRGCRRHKSFSDAPLSGSGGGDLEIHRGSLGTRGKRRRHHSKSEGVRLGDAGARRP